MLHWHICISKYCKIVLERDKSQNCLPERSEGGKKDPMVYKPPKEGSKRTKNRKSGSTFRPIFQPYMVWVVIKCGWLTAKKPLPDGPFCCTNVCHAVGGAWTFHFFSATHEIQNIEDEDQCPTAQITALPLFFQKSAKSPNSMFIYVWWHWPEICQPSMVKERTPMGCQLCSAKLHFSKIFML